MATSEDQPAGRVALVIGVSRPEGIAATTAQRLHDEGATVMATGWPAHDAEIPQGEHAAVAGQFPEGRWGTPDDIAGAVSFLVGDCGSWIRGQVLDVGGGFGYGHL